MSTGVKLSKGRIVLWMLLMASAIGNCQNREQEDRPNILFILSDDHTSQAWGIYGGILEKFVQNQNIKRLAREGTVLENAFCTNSICTPSRASILTGQYSHVNQVYTLNEPLPREHPNIAATLSQNGYETSIIGKWHLVGEPEGFHYFNVLPGQGRYWDPILKTKENWMDGHDASKGKEYKGFSTDVITDLTLARLKSRDTTRPFLMFCNFKATHEPFDYPERFKSLYEDVEIPEPESLMDFGAETTGRSFKGQVLEHLADRWQKATENPKDYWTNYPGLPYDLEGLDSVQRRKKIYQKLVKDFMRSGAAIDDNIGKLLDFLDAEGLTDNTVVVYTADQGYFLGEHGFFDKRLIYEESLRMPFVIRYPKEVMAGRRLDDIILNIDFSALLADYAGIAPPGYIQGKSFRNNLRGSTSEDWRQDMYYRYWLHHPDRPAHFGIRDERYKLAFFYGKGLGKKGSSAMETDPAWEFYDLRDDVGENENLIGDAAYREEILRMKDLLVARKKALGDLDGNYPEINELVQKPIFKE